MCNRKHIAAQETRVSRPVLNCTHTAAGTAHVLLLVRHTAVAFAKVVHGPRTWDDVGRTRHSQRDQAQRLRVTKREQRIYLRIQYCIVTLSVNVHRDWYKVGAWCTLWCVTAAVWRAATCFMRGLLHLQ